MNSIPKSILRTTTLTIFVFFALVFFATEQNASAATLSLTPGSGTYEVGSTFDVSIMLNTEGSSVNAVKASLFFSADSLQVTSPSTGQSIVTLWASPPTYSNSAGTILFEGGFQNGTNVTSGLITKITFRVKSTGTAIIKLKDDSKVLLDDGKGTDVLSQTNNGIYTLTLPPPAGPEVGSETHPDQSRWYNNPSVALKWADLDPALAEEYSYILSDNPSEIPDDVSDGQKNGVVYKNLSDGRHYFHIKALNSDKIWGGTTHYALNIDRTPPADFSLDIFPSSSTARRNPLIQFITTDSTSGMDHYELKIIPLGNVNYSGIGAQDSQKMFIEASSPYTAQNLELGNYDVLVRAYDAAGNFTDFTKRLQITNAFLQIVSDEGLVIRGQTVVSWPWIFLVILLIICFLGYLLWRSWRHHRKLEIARSEEQVPIEIQQKMAELDQLKKKYKGLVVVLIFIVSNFFLISSTKAGETTSEINPPLITTISKNISNDEIFYIGGKAEADGEKVTAYIKNTQTGEAFSEEISTDSRGEWFYRHDAFLSEGEYIIWTQSKIGGQVSPPSPQVKMTVTKTAFQFGSSRISYKLIFSLIISLLFLIIIVMLFYISLSAQKIREKSTLFKKEVGEIEDAVHRGFMVLHREINREFKLLEELNAKKPLSANEREYREHLMSDLKKIERHIEKEIIDVEKLLS
jgi:hypothetical protein